MKKQIIVSSFIAAAILGGTVILSVAKAESPKEEEKKLLATNSVIATPSPIINSTKTETVYVIDDANGNVKSKFIGSTLYAGAEELPFTMKVAYYLNGAEIEAKDLAGKSGHVKIVYSYDSTATYNGSYIPFLALTTINLDRLKFNNIKLTSGKIFNENSSTATIIGYSVTGMSKNLGTNFLPDNFVLEADTTDFKLGDTYTIFTNDVLTDIDTSKLNRVDELTNSMYQLEDGINKLVNGATELSNGLSSALDGTKTLYEGSKTLASGTKDAAAGASKLTNLSELVKNNDSLNKGAKNTFNVFLSQTLASIQNNTSLVNAINAYGQAYGVTVPTELTIEDYSATLTKLIGFVNDVLHGDPSSLETAKASLDNYNTFYTGLATYTSYVADAATGATTLSAGLTKLSDGATTLSDGLGSLVEGENKLYQGSITLKDGLSTFKSSGIDKLVDFATKDLTSFARNLRATITSAGTYKNFGGVDAKSVKFIVKTPAI